MLLTENLHRATSNLWEAIWSLGGVKKQKVVALSSVEAEFRGMAKGLCDLFWLKRLLEEIGCSSQDTMNLFCDNKAAITIAHNSIQHNCTKHVEVDVHFIKQKLEDKVI